MRDGILVINAGSSSIKFSLYLSNGEEKPLLASRGQVEGIAVSPHFIALSPNGSVVAEERWDDPHLSHDVLFKHLMTWVEDAFRDAVLKAAGHRVVHGGANHSAPVIVTDAVLDELAELIPLAPLHQPHNLAPIRALRKIYPDLVQVACFDTAFHRTNPKVAQSFAIPRALSDEGVRRYGFHGLSYEYISRQLERVAPEVAGGRVVVFHLGSGASMCAIREGKSVASTMGFTALDGLPMGTRTGAIDPGVLLYLMQRKEMAAKEIETLLYKKSGLLGVSGISNDMRILLASDDPHAVEAIDLFVYRVGRELGSLAAALGGLDALVFTAGIGENSPEIRARVCEQAAWLGVRLDSEANSRHAQRISAPESSVPVFIIPTDEEMMIAKHTRAAIRALRAG
ncbi:MAG: acetate/propionate family kinase [Magnetospirillum sp.]|nr:acetate/propionate family kinase [Magnetospirillum sp.]